MTFTSTVKKYNQKDFMDAIGEAFVTSSMKDDKELRLQVIERMCLLTHEVSGFSPELLHKNHFIEMLLCYCAEDVYALSALAKLAEQQDLRDEICKALPWDVLCRDGFQTHEPRNNRHGTPKLLLTISGDEKYVEYFSQTVMSYVTEMIHCGVPLYHEGGLEIMSRLADHRESDTVISTRPLKCHQHKQQRESQNG